MVKSTIQPKNTEDDFLKAYDDYSDAIFRFCYQKIGNRESAIDLTQITFMKVWKHIKEGGEITHWRGLLYRVARNSIFDEYRKQGLEVKVEKIDFQNFDIQDNDSNPQIDFEINQMKEKLSSYLDKFSPLNRDIIAFRYLENMSLDEIAIALRINKNIVSVRLHRVTKQLQDLIKNDQAKYEK